MFRDIRERLGNDEVGGRLDRVAASAGQIQLHLGRDRRPIRSGLDGRAEPGFTEDSGMDPASELAYVLQDREDFRAPGSQDGVPFRAIVPTLGCS